MPDRVAPLDGADFNPPVVKVGPGRSFVVPEDAELPSPPPQAESKRPREIADIAFRIDWGFRRT
jgi:hypothetical protein